MNISYIQETQEIWRYCVGYENKYMVSNYGRVKSLPYTYIYPTTQKKKFYKEKIKKQCETSKRKNSTQGYLCTRLVSADGKSEAKLVHILVAKAFIPNPNNLPTVNHKDGNKHNNRVDNLEWATYSSNNQHAYDNNLKTDNQILIRTKDNIIENIFVSENDASLKTEFTPQKIRRFLNENIVDDYGCQWYKFEMGKFLIQEIESNIITHQND